MTSLATGAFFPPTRPRPYGHRDGWHRQTPANPDRSGSGFSLLGGCQQSHRPSISTGRTSPVRQNLQIALCSLAETTYSSNRCPRTLCCRPSASCTVVATAWSTLQVVPPRVGPNSARQSRTTKGVWSPARSSVSDQMARVSRVHPPPHILPSGSRRTLMMPVGCKKTW